MLHCQKDAFSLPEGLHYLNCAYMAPLARRVEEAGAEGLRRKRNPAAIGPEDFFDESRHVRQLFAELVHAPGSEHVAIIPSASYGIATAARNLPLRSGQNIVTAAEQFPSNVYVWRRLAQEHGLSLRAIAPPETGTARGRGWNERLLDAIDAKTAVVALGHVHWTDGTRFDLEAISRRARDAGAALVVDGTQSVGALPFDVERIQPDALICAGYKWLLGPYSIGLAYFGPRLLDGVPLEENWITRRDSEVFSRLVDYVDDYQPGAARYDVGERSNFILVPMLVAALELIAAWGVDAIQDYCHRLVQPLLDEALDLGYLVEDAAWRGAHLFGVRLPAGRSTEALRTALAARNVAVSLRGSAVRIAPHVYNDEHDVAALQNALRAGAGAVHA